MKTDDQLRTELRALALELRELLPVDDDADAVVARIVADNTPAATTKRRLTRRART